MVAMTNNRKLVAFLVAVALACGLGAFGQSVPPEAFRALEWLFAAFIAGNGVEHGAKAYKEARELGAELFEIAEDLDDE